jgi:hypothetical protein
MDLLWYAQESGAPISEVAEVMGLTEEQVQRAYADFDAKRRVSAYLLSPPVGIEIVH